jgi:large subunit ribosomal protein L24
MAARIKKGDMVVVISGEHKNKTGRVLEVDAKSSRVLIEGLNRVWKHLRPNQRNQQGGRIQKEAPIHISNVLPIDPSTGKGTRVRFQVKDGVKHRVAKSGADLGAV